MKKLVIVLIAAVLTVGALSTLTGCRCNRRGARNMNYHQAPPPPPQQQPITQENADRVETYESEREVGRHSEGVIQGDK